MSDARYVWVDNIGYVKVGEDGIPNVQQHVNQMNAGLRDASTTDIRVANTGNHGWLFGGDLMDRVGSNINSAYGDFSNESWDRFHAAGGSGNPLIDTHPDDIAAILEMYKDESWNPFYDRYYASGDTPGVENNVADYLFGLTKESSQLHNRGQVMRRYQHWLNNSGTGPGNMKDRLTARDMMDAEMSQGMFDALGLGDLGYQYQTANQPANTPANTPANEPTNTPPAESPPPDNIVPGDPPTPPPPLTTAQQLTGLFGTDWQRGTQRTGTWGSGHSQGFTGSQIRNQAKSMYEQNPSLLGDDTESMRKAIITALENKILG
jgi:hypothetical protein